MNSRYSVLIAVSILLCDGVTQAQEEEVRPGGIAAIVGDDVIIQSELDRRVDLELNSRGGALSSDDLKQNKPALERYVLDKMIDDLLVLQQIWQLQEGSDSERKGEKEKKEGAAGRPVAGNARSVRTRRYIPDAAVDREINERIETLRQHRVNIRNESDFYQHIEQTVGLDRSQIRTYIREELGIRRYLWEKVFSTVDPFVSPRESCIYYDNHVEEFTTPVEVSFRQIFLLPDRVNSYVAIKQINEGLKNDVSFIELAKQFSQDFDDPESRGRIWKRSFEELRSWMAPIPQKLRSMEKGEVAGPFRTEAGVYYLQLVDRVDGQPKSYEEVQEEIEKKIVRERQELKYKMFMEELRERSFVEKLLAGAERSAAVEEKSDEPEGASGAGTVPTEPQVPAGEDREAAETPSS